MEAWLSPSATAFITLMEQECVLFDFNYNPCLRASEGKILPIFFLLFAYWYLCASETSEITNIHMKYWAHKTVCEIFVVQ